MPVVVITGAARGIGASTAEAMAQAGWSVALVDSVGQFGENIAAPEPPAESDLGDVAERCRRHAPAVDIVADVRSRESLIGAVKVAAGELGPIDAAVAAAGKIAGSKAWETPEPVWRELLNVNLGGVRNLAEAVVPRFLERGGSARFVAVASASATKGLEMLGAYGASKGAVVGYVRSLAADLRGTGVTANVISPGSTDTEMLDASARVFGLEGRESFAHHQLLGRILTSEEVAAGIRFVCGPEASGLTGAVIPIDGGMTA